MGYASDLQAFVRRFVSDAAFRREFRSEPERVLTGYGFSGGVAEAIRGTLGRNDVDVSDGVAALKATLKEPDSNIWW